MFNWSVLVKKHPVFCASVVLALLLAGCGNAQSTATSSANPSATKVITTSSKAITSAQAILTHMPSGNATFLWNNANHVLSIQLALTGLAPGSTHPVQLLQGGCGSQGKELYPLLNLVADAHGSASGTSKVVVSKGMPVAGWSLNVSNGPGLAQTNQAISLVCNTLSHGQMALLVSQTAQLSLNASPAAGQRVTGHATLSLSEHTLQVQLVLTGLIPGSKHAAHIHTGSCARQGAVVYSLPVLQADAAGNVSLTTTFQHVQAIPVTGWYVNVHLSTDLSTQTGFDPIACGNVMAQ